LTNILLNYGISANFCLLRNYIVASISSIWQLLSSMLWRMSLINSGILKVLYAPSTWQSNFLF
jgi:hypothetical protein